MGQCVEYLVGRVLVWGGGRQATAAALDNRPCESLHEMGLLGSKPLKEPTRIKFKSMRLESEPWEDQILLSEIVLESPQRSSAKQNHHPFMVNHPAYREQRGAQWHLTGEQVM